ncbi:unnamed protein product [Mucor hiemalis]
MFTTRSNNSKLPFYKSYTKKSAKQKQKWFLRLAILTIVVIFLLGRWHKSPTNKKASSENNNKQSTNNALEVILKTPSPTDARDFEELTIAREVELKPVGDRIPKIVHFVYGLRDPEPTLDLIHYTAIKSAHDVLKPDKIMFHYHHMPVGENFERAKPMLSLRQVPLVTTVFDKPVTHYAHKADVVRLQVLEKYGGIYLDLDLISLKPIDHLLDREFVMAQEGVEGSIGLCNAMIMARPRSRFVQRWYSTYASFDSTNWNYHSVILPGNLAPFFPKEITVLNHTAYFWPLWDSHGLRALYLEKSYDFSANLGTHVWESAANKNLMKDISEKVVMEIDNSLYCQLRPFLLDGKPDPRPNSCRILSHTERSDKLIGHWSLKQPSQIDKVEINPMPAEDDSGNNLNGLIRNGQYDDSSASGVYLSGDTSYIFLTVPTETSIRSFTVSWWMKTSVKEGGKMAMVLQTENGRMCLKTNKMLENGGISLNFEIIKRNDAWEWDQVEEPKLRPSPYTIDDEYHHFALVINSKASSYQRGEPRAALYMDGHVTSSSKDWEYPEYAGLNIKGLWFGSIEPLSDHYQDPWDNSVNLEGFYRDIRAWERGLSVNEVTELYTFGRSEPLKTKKTKVKPEEEYKNKVDEEEEEEEDEEDEDEELWMDEDQMDD